MATAMMERAISLALDYIEKSYSQKEKEIIVTEFNKVIPDYLPRKHTDNDITYDSLQRTLSNINEKGDKRKEQGVYYTPNDIVDFILMNSAKLACGRLNSGNLHVMDLNGIPYSIFCYEKSIFDPTCGAGEFLLSALNKKFDLLELHHDSMTAGRISRVVETIYGNDTNKDSTDITKIRILLCVAYRYGAKKVKDLADVLNTRFENYDYVTCAVKKKKYDIIIGNPPYVEDAKSGLNLKTRYGNIYANVLDNASKQLNSGGVIGFVVPLSYVSTPRMQNIREVLSSKLGEQYILSYADRPDCLFTSVHQKLCLLFGKTNDGELTYYTGNYTYWYKEESENLFRDAAAVHNSYVCDGFIPKVGNPTDVSIYSKIQNQPLPIDSLLSGGTSKVYLNMRAAFWIKAFLGEHVSGEYKTFGCANENYRNYAMCLLNSSMFWWYWICVSDCWHITNKELSGFRYPELDDYRITNRLAKNLENRLETTKVFVGTKQTEYEYKHRDCIKEIHAIDDYLAAIYGLTDEESLYIKNFAYRYRISGGAKDGRN